MKDELEHIDQIFKQSFDGFEADVDPNVWSTIQNTIGSNSATTSSGSLAVKSITLKIVTGVIALGVIVTGIYIVSDKKESIENQVVGHQTLVVKEQTDLNVEVVDKQEKQAVEEVVIKHISSENITPTQRVTAVEEKADEKNIIKDGEIQKQAIQTTTNLPVELNTSKEEKETPLVETATAIYAVSLKENSDTKELAPTFVPEEKEKLEEEDFEDDVEPLLTENALSPILYKERIPKAFSPNGDGINDVISIEGKNIKEFQAIILNASNGKVVFEWNWLEGFWDGRDKLGNKVPKGTYMLQVIAVGEDGVSIDPILQSITVY